MVFRHARHADARASGGLGLDPRGPHTLIAAPTGSGKTLAAFLIALDDLLREGLDAPLPDETRVVYVSPLKALSSDIHKNLSSRARRSRRCRGYGTAGAGDHLRACAPATPRRRRARQW